MRNEELRRGNTVRFGSALPPHLFQQTFEVFLVVNCAQHPLLQRHPLLAVVDAVVVQQPERHLVLCKPGAYDVDVAVHVAGLAHAAPPVMERTACGSPLSPSPRTREDVGCFLF